MKQINKKQLLRQLEEMIENQVKEVTEMYEQESDEVLLKPTVNGGWSIVQCLEHINTYAAYYHPLISKALAEKKHVSLKEFYSSTWLGNYFINITKPVENGKKYKAIKMHLPARNLNADSVITTFLNYQQEMIGFLQEAADADLDAIRIPVSIAKWIRLKLGDVLQFIAVHNKRHLLQAQKNYASQTKLSINQNNNC